MNPWNRRVVEKCRECDRERSGLLLMRIVPAALEALEGDAAKTDHEGMAVRDRDHRIAIAPDQRGRWQLHFTAALEEQVPLTAPIDDMA